MATGWAPLKSPPPVVPSLGPFRETKTISGTGFFTCLAGLTSTDRPTFHPSVTRSFPPDVADEGDTPSTSLREGSEPHPPACEAQCRVQVSVPMEGSAQGAVKSKRGRPPQKPPRTHRGAQSQAASRLSTPGSDPEPRAPLPLRQHEDLEPSAAEHREVLAACAGPRDPLRGHRDLIHPASKTLDQLVPGHHTGQIGPLCLQDAQPQAPMSLPFGPNVHLHLHLHLLGLWQENPTCPWHQPREQICFSSSGPTPPPREGGSGGILPRLPV
ncbi:uncharacterized protein LOC122685227 [Cervus elaphus]|uniref:uncharacterized protein LOC122685227 n=1 Tax=Cervus elaphus TaxID=9860 RepID=UPI001CC2813B|nr:uncharacterized protein LOC122685227 [Cervus elaphus]